jgi:hypothetical protein
MKDRITGYECVVSAKRWAISVFQWSSGSLPHLSKLSARRTQSKCRPPMSYAANMFWNAIYLDITTLSLECHVILQPNVQLGSDYSWLQTIATFVWVKLRVAMAPEAKRVLEASLGLRRTLMS